MVKTHILTDLKTEKLTTSNAKVTAMEADKIKVRNSEITEANAAQQRENGGVVDSDIMTTRKIVLHNDHDDQSNGNEPATTLTYDETKKSMVIDGDVEITGKLTSSNQVVEIVETILLTPSKSKKIY